MKFIGYFLPYMPYRIVYMMQQHEYDHRKFLTWLTTMPDLGKVVNRGKLEQTNKARLMLVVGYITYIGWLACVVYLLLTQKYLSGLVAFIVWPDVVICILFLLLLVGSSLLAAKRAPLMKRAEAIFAGHQGVRIAVLGSYGKTTMKEMLATILSERFKVAMTPGNKNVPISHARWVTKLSGDEDVIITEYGEGEPGDIDRLARLTQPNMAIMTGVAPNHLDQYKSLSALEDDLASIGNFVSGEKLYVNADAKSVVAKLPEPARLYSVTAVEGWRITDIKVQITGTSFVMKRGAVGMKLHTSLLGAHNVAPLAAAVAIAYDLGLSSEEIQAGVGKTVPFEHRMQARRLHGAWLIDDTYNGNLEGFKAGLSLLAQLDAKRKIYVTPGLVDQGEETERVHVEIGHAIAKTNPDKVVLMQNDNTEFIQQGMKSEGYQGEVITENDPLNFYNNIEQFVAAGDLVLMQNDLPDAYR